MPTVLSLGFTLNAAYNWNNNLASETGGDTAKRLGSLSDYRQLVSALGGAPVRIRFTRWLFNDPLAGRSHLVNRRSAIPLVGTARHRFPDLYGATSISGRTPAQCSSPTRCD